MEYEILQEADSERLTALVNGYIGNGWKPQGGIACYSTQRNIWFYQAMIKETLDANTNPQP